MWFLNIQFTNEDMNALEEAKEPNASFKYILHICILTNLLIDLVKQVLMACIFTEL